MKNLLPGWRLTAFLTTAADPSHSLRMTINVPLTMTLNVLYKDHGVGRQKELLAHVVRLRILACRNDLNRKRIVSLQLTAHSSQLTADSFYLLTAFHSTVIDSSYSFRMTFYRPLSLRTGGRKRIFILFFCVVPPSQYPPSGSAGHLLINKEAYPIPILPVRIPFLNTVADPSLAL